MKQEPQTESVKTANSTEPELQYLRKISERNVARIMKLDMQSIAIRQELEQKRRGFALLAELSTSLRHQAGYEDVFVPAARRINAALNMQRTAVLTPDGNGCFRAAVLQGYPQDEEKRVASRRVEADAELLDPARPVLITGADSAERLAAFREAVGIPYLISSPAFLHDGSVAAILVTGRKVEEEPFMCRLGRSDVETVQAISSLLAAVLVEKRLVDDLSRARDLAEQSARVKGEFLANMSHEVHTPMNAILGMARILSGSELTGQLRQNAERIMQSSRLLLRIFDDILDFSSLDVGRITLQIGEFSVRGVMDNICALVKERVREKSLSFRVQIEPDVPDAVLGDAARVEQVLLNLTDNAVKFTNSGEVSVRISRQADAERANAQGANARTVRLLFEVKDTGIGMSEKDLADIFLPFTQIDASYTRKYGGTGLGLAICGRLAELMRGEIRCESQLGKGSKITFAAPFELPEKAIKPDAAQTGSAGAEGENSETGNSETENAETENLEALRGMRVLLAEDNEINQLVAMDVLSSMGVDVTVANNGIEALKALENGVFDLVLMDIQMPEMDGLTATARIRANPKYKDLPIVALTAHAQPEDREASFKSGMNDHLTKPIDPDTIYTVLLHQGRGPWTR